MEKCMARRKNRVGKTLTAAILINDIPQQRPIPMGARGLCQLHTRGLHCPLLARSRELQKDSGALQKFSDLYHLPMAVAPNETAKQ